MITFVHEGKHLFKVSKYQPCPVQNPITFLAAMGSSKIDDVTQFVHPFVVKNFFFSIKSYNGVSRKPKGCFNEV